MGVSVSVLASGSRGNSTVVSSSRTKILVDAGISCRETVKRMRAQGDDPRALSAILITHEHSDHVYGLAVLARKFQVPVFMTGATHQAWAGSLRDDAGELPQLARLEIFSAGHSFAIGDIAITPFTIPHDAADPVGLTFRADGVKVGIATDLGYMPPNVCDQLRRLRCAGHRIESRSGDAAGRTLSLVGQAAGRKSDGTPVQRQTREILMHRIRWQRIIHSAGASVGAQQPSRTRAGEQRKRPWGDARHCCTTG